MNNYKILIVKDEVSESKKIEDSLLKTGHAVPLIAESCEKAIELIEQHRPDIVLMDVIFKGEPTGLEYAGIFRERYQLPVIFISSPIDDNIISKAKFTEPYAFIITPFKDKDLEISVEMAIYKHDKISQMIREKNLFRSLADNNKVNANSIFVRANYRLNRIKFEDLYYVEALKDYVTIYTKDSMFTTHATMKEMIKILPEQEYVRIHRSFIVRLDKIYSIKYPDLIIDGKMKILPIGGLFRKTLYSRLNMI